MENVQQAESFVIPKKKKMARHKTQGIFILSFITYPLILFIIFYVAVNINSIIMAFCETKLDGTQVFVGFKNFTTFWNSLMDSGNVVSISLINSLKMYAINLIVCIPLYIFFSYLLYKKCFMHRTIRAVVMLPQIISGFVICMLFVNFMSGDGAPIRAVFEKLGIFTDSEGIGLDLLYSEKYAFGTTIFYGIWLSFGTNLIVYPNAMKEISPEIVESAKLDGVTNMFQDLRYIVLPLIFPTLSTFLVTGLAGIFTDSGSILAFYNTNAPEYVSNMGYYYSQLVLKGTDVTYPILAAGGLIMTLIVAPLTILLKYLLDKFGPTTEA